jgi:cytoskeletal protein RodZ
MDDPQSLNLYNYVGNNPVTRVDADGHVAGVDDAVVGAAVGITILAVASEAYFSQPEHTRDASAALSAATSSVVSTIHGWFSKDTDRGRANEGVGLKEVGAKPNKNPQESSTVTDPKTGKQVTTKPDGKMADGTHVEVKDTKVVRSTPQLRAQGVASKAESGNKPILVTGTNTKVSDSVGGPNGTHTVVRTPKLGPQ